MPALVDISGATFGRLTAVERCANMGRFVAWRCACKCGATVNVRSGSLQSGNTTSCGCTHREQVKRQFTKHGASRTPEHCVWVLMRDRCNNRNNSKFAYYGGRGIVVCPRWNDFATFLADMGSRPTPMHTLDRIDPNGNYSPENCRWATRKEQARNRGITKRYERNGETKSLGEWAELVGKPYMVVYKRLWRGWTLEDALTKPLKGDQN